jgi:hypothetical protein
MKGAKISSLRRIAMGTSALCLFAACSNPNVKTDFDPSVDFSRFRTFAFMGLSELNGGDVFDNSLTRKRIESMVGQELTNKGLQQVNLAEHPNLLVHYWLGAQVKQQIEDTGYYGSRRVYGPYGGLRIYEYKEGTLIVDLIESAKKELVWRATMVSNLKDTSQENMELGRKAIAKAFENYPPSRAQ